MWLRKYKYYFRKPKSEIVKDVLSWLAIAGIIYIAASSPYFIRNLIKAYQKRKRYPKKKIVDTFYNLRKQGLIEFGMKRKQIYIRLTEKGRKKANWMQINDLKIKRPKKWDGWWRLVIFDIAQIKKIYREALRGKLKELGFYRLQDSVWIYPFDCQVEIELLKNFFGLSDKEMKLVLAKDIGKDRGLKKFFKLD